MGKTNPENLPAFPYTTDPDKIPVERVLDITPESGVVHVNYACPRACWVEHLDAWRKAYRTNKGAPQPMPAGHVMFERPEIYGCVRYGDASLESKRKAIESHVRSMLHGWDADMTPEQRDKIVHATVEAKMQGHDVGAVPFIACLMTNL